jgi:signal transduction histidine kinase
MALALWTALALATGAALWHLRQDAIAQQTRELTLLSLSLTDEIDRGLRGAEEGLRALRTELQAGRLPAPGPERQSLLATRAALMPLIRRLWLVDAQGALLAGSDASAPPTLASFAPVPPADTGLSLSRPFVDAASGETLVGVAVRHQGVAGLPAGWLLAAVPARTLLGAFASALPEAAARLSVIRSDGVYLAGTRAPSATFNEERVARRLAQRAATEVRTLRNGTQHLIGVQAVPRYNVTVIVSRELPAVLGGWRQTAEGALAALLLLLGVMGSAVLLVQRAERRHRVAQQALQAQVARAGRLEALGTLAGSVAHDFNNVLAGIVGFGEMAQDEAVPDSDQARHLDKVLKAAQRGKGLVERILSFGRGGARQSVVFALEPVVEEVLALLSASLRAGIVLERGLEAPAARLRGDPTQAFEAAMNLCANALQAMPQGGLLSVQLQREQVLAKRILSHSELPPGPHVVLSVADQGAGIPPEVLEHLFEPFFTTRAAQSGTGLGLAVVHGVVQEFGGAIDVHSVPGQGARFTLYFPECFDALTAPVAAGPAAPSGAEQALLVLDDDPALVALAQELLGGLGYRPVGFTDPQQALQALRDDPQRWAGVLTDEAMPGLTGTQFTQALRAFLPQLPVLLVSGYGGAALAERAAAAGVTQVLAKPLGREELAKALAALLR